MFSVLTEGCHVGNSRDFVGTVYCTYGQSNTTNNRIRSKIPWPKLVNFSASPARVWQTGCLWWEIVQSRFHVYLKSNFALKNNSMEFSLGPITRRINVLHESRMKWTWHHSKLAVAEVSFYGGLRVVLLQLLSIHDRAVGVTNLGVMLLCWRVMFSVPAGGCHVGYSRKSLGTVYCTYGQSNTTIVLTVIYTVRSNTPWRHDMGHLRHNYPIVQGIPVIDGLPLRQFSYFCR